MKGMWTRYAALMAVKSHQRYQERATDPIRSRIVEIGGWAGICTALGLVSAYLASIVSPQHDVIGSWSIAIAVLYSTAYFGADHIFGTVHGASGGAGPRTHNLGFWMRLSLRWAARDVQWTRARELSPVRTKIYEAQVWGAISLITFIILAHPIVVTFPAYARVYFLVFLSGVGMVSLLAGTEHILAKNDAGGQRPPPGVSA